MRFDRLQQITWFIFSFRLFCYQDVKYIDKSSDLADLCSDLAI